MVKRDPGAIAGSFETLRKLAATPSAGPAVPPLDTTPGALPAISREPAAASTPPPNAAPTVQEATVSPDAAEIDGYQVYDPNREYKVGDRILLPLELFGQNPRNHRVFTFDEEMKSLVASLAANGQLETAYVYPKGKDGKFKGKGGQRRSVALGILGKPFLKSEIVAPAANELEEFKQIRAMNAEHAKPSYIDDAIRFAELLTDGVAPDQTTLAHAMNISTGDMSKMLSVAEMPTLILEPMAENIKQFGLSSGYAIFRYWKKMDKDEERTLALVAKVVEGRLSVRALEDLVKDAVPTGRPAGTRQHALARALLRGPGEGELKCYRDGKVSVQLGKMDPAKRDDIYSRMMTVLRDAGFEVESGAAAEA